MLYLPKLLGDGGALTAGLLSGAGIKPGQAILSPVAAHPESKSATAEVWLVSRIELHLRCAIRPCNLDQLNGGWRRRPRPRSWPCRVRRMAGWAGSHAK